MDMGGLRSLRFFLWSQFVTATFTTTLASSVLTAGPLIETCSNALSMSFFNLFLRRVFIRLTAIAALSGHAFVIGAEVQLLQAQP